MSVLVAFAGAAGACERENPGFKLKDTSDDQGEVTSLMTTSVSGPTVTGDTGMTVPTTTGPDPTTTSSGPDVTGSVGTTETSTTQPVDPTTGEMLPWNNDCSDPAEMETVEYTLLGDTFFMVSDEGVGTGCDIGGGMSIQGYFCADFSFGKSPAQQIFHYDVPGLDDNQLSVFALHFEPRIIDDGVDEVPIAAFIDLTLLVAFDRLDDPDEPVSLRLLRMNPLDVWMEGNNMTGAVCAADDSSYRCRGCIDNKPGDCKPAWTDTTPFNGDSPEVKAFTVGAADPMQLFEIDLPTSELEHLKGPHAGFVVVPDLELKDAILAVRTKEFEPTTAARLVARYCKDPNKR